ncbi:hypothetical protein [uncultured Ruminococcus sp.]|uniref:hypothetical protein n=1 Tax=uncultured Ruminococcus sp. TaxID=165186 RepID=UPI000EE1B853|nr:hypothetical protein [uncultured Ruminococcus sp.]HCJ41788.1 hypothetical protein [Ruminococcus sp.]
MISARKLTEKEYLATMSDGMKNVTDTAERLTDIWAYASQSGVREVISEYGFENRLIEAVYENGGGSYQHVLLYGVREDTYAVIVVDVRKRAVFGHYLLDIGEKYGL